MITRFFKTIYQIGAYTHNLCRSTRPNEQSLLLMPATSIDLDSKHSTATAFDSNFETSLVIHSHAEIEKLTREAAEDKRVADVIQAGVHTKCLKYSEAVCMLLELVGASLILINPSFEHDKSTGTYNSTIRAGIIIAVCGAVFDLALGMSQGFSMIQSLRGAGTLPAAGECQICPERLCGCISRAAVDGYLNKIQVDTQYEINERVIVRDEFIEASQEHHRQQVVRINEMINDNKIMRETARHLQSFFCPKDRQLAHRLPKEILPIIMGYAAPVRIPPSDG